MGQKWPNTDLVARIEALYRNEWPGSARCRHQSCASTPSAAGGVPRYRRPGINTVEQPPEAPAVIGENLAFRRSPFPSVKISHAQPRTVLIALCFDPATACRTKRG